MRHKANVKRREKIKKILRFSVYCEHFVDVDDITLIINCNNLNINSIEVN
jgi:hypothetical protein